MKEEVLKKIKPGLAEIRQNNELAARFIKEIQKEGYEATLVGSRARGTFISGDRDIDIFVFFPKTTKRKDLEKKGVELGKKILAKYKPKTHYAEHPYVKAEVDGLCVELVPCYKIKPKEKIISAVDRSPLHNLYIKKKIEEKQKDDVILLKQFLKTANLYGADQRVKGFSGYLCELLIIYHGDFEKLLKKASHEWDKKIIIDIEKLRQRYEKFKESLVVIDPVDAERNVASAVSRSSLSKFIITAREYLEKPDKKFFFPKKKRMNLKKLLKGRKLVTVSFDCPDAIPEIVWSQLERLTKNIKERLYENEFQTYRTGFWTDEEKKCGAVFELSCYELPKYEKHKGPEIWDETHCKAFINKNKTWWIQRSVLYAWRERKFKTAAEVIENALKTPDLVPSHFQKVVKKHKIRLAYKAHKEKELMRKYFEE